MTKENARSLRWPYNANANKKCLEYLEWAAPSRLHFNLFSYPWDDWGIRQACCGCGSQECPTWGVIRHQLNVFFLNMHHIISGANFFWSIWTLSSSHQCCIVYSVYSDKPTGANQFLLEGWITKTSNHRGRFSWLLVSWVDKVWSRRWALLSAQELNQLHFTVFSIISIES